MRIEGRRRRCNNLGRPESDSAVECPRRAWHLGLVGLDRHELIHCIELDPIDVGNAVACLLGCLTLDLVNAVACLLGRSKAVDDLGAASWQCVVDCVQRP